MRQDQERKEAAMMEALQSPKWESGLVAEHYLRWLKRNRHVEESCSIKDAVGAVLHRMVLDGEFAAGICKSLDTWKAWADNAGMRKSDFIAVRDAQAIFAQASLLISVIKDTGSAMRGTLAMDLQECLAMWKKVRLG